MTPDFHLKVNNFALRSFRDVADQDYIAARLAFRADLLPQFLWAAQQSIEKYLKALLCFYRIPAVKLRHDVEKALKLAETELPFPLELGAQARKTIDHIAAYGVYRYLEAPWHITGHFLPKFDFAIWELRRYCRPVDATRLDQHGTDPAVLAAIRQADTNNPTAYRLPGGFLEAVIDNREHLSRDALLWQNPCYSTRRRERIRSRFKLNAANPPLSIHPEIIDELCKLVFVPSDVQQACRTIWGPKREAARKRRAVN